MQKYTHDEGVKLVVELLLDGKILPIIGSGFTAGSKSQDGYVLNGNELKGVMIKNIMSNSKDFTETELKLKRFSELSETFFEEVDTDSWKKIIHDKFTNVSLDEYKVKFLKSWKYIYTINIDDGIEKATNFKTILPYSSLDKNYGNLLKDKNYVLKLHGDAEFELFSTENRIIFSSSQYITSLMSEKNKQLVNCLLSDFKQKNMIFIGCSLEDEDDLKQIYKNIESESHKSLIIQLRSKMPDVKEIKNLKRYGVNSIILVNSYDSFYKDFNVMFEKKRFSDTATSYRFVNPKTEKTNLTKTILENISYGTPPFNVKSGKFFIPSTSIVRKISKRIADLIDVEPFILAVGRRFTGKTTILQNVVELSPKYKTIYFPSGYLVSEEVFLTLLQENNDSLFIFDTNSISSDVYHAILSQKDYFVESGNKMIIASTTNEDFLIQRLKAKYVEIPSYLQQYEIDEYNNIADRLAFIKRKAHQSNLEYSYQLLSQHSLELKFIRLHPDKLSSEQKIILYMLAVFDVLYYHEAQVLGISFKRIEEFIEENPILFEFVDCDPEESHGKSVHKVVHNSRALILHILQKFTENDAVQCITCIVKNLYIYEKELYKSAIMFDTLNQIFNPKSGAGYLIDALYANLEDFLFSEPHFWLQRAKSIYRVHKKDKGKLLTAISYTNKITGDNIRANVVMKASFTAGLIYLTLFKVEECAEQRKNYQISAIQSWYASIIKSKVKYLPQSIENEVLRGQFGRERIIDSIKDLCLDFVSPENREKYQTIVNQSLDVVAELKNIETNSSSAH